MRLPWPVAFAAACVLTQAARAAEPNDYILVPTVVYGERAVEIKAGSFSGPGPRDSATALSFEYSPTAWWVTEVYVTYARSGGTGTRFDGFESENRFQLTEPGEYAIDWGGVVEVEKPHAAGSGWNLRVGPLMQGEFANRFQWNFNPLLSRNLGGPAQPITPLLDGPTRAATQLGYQVQVQYRYRESLGFGVQGFGDLGPWAHWTPLEQQTHRFGPAVIGRIGLGGRRSLYYNAAWLFGLVPGAPSDTVRAQIEFEF